MHALKIGLFGTFAGPVLFFVLGLCLYALGVGLALLCLVIFPVMSIFFPQKLIEFTRPTDEDHAIARRMDARFSSSLLDPSDMTEEAQGSHG